MSRRVILLPNSGTAQFVLPNTAKVRVYSLSAVITTDATVGDRAFFLQVVDKAGVGKVRVSAPGVMTASKIYTMTFAVGMQSQATGTHYNQALPDLVLEIDDRIIFSDGNEIAAGDRVTAVVAVVDVLEA